MTKPQEPEPTFEENLRQQVRGYDQNGLASAVYLGLKEIADAIKSLAKRDE